MSEIKETLGKKIMIAILPVLLSGVGITLFEFYELRASVERIDSRLDALIELVINKEK